MYISYIILFVMIVLMAVTCGLDIRKGRVREYGEVIHGIIVMLVVSVWEICINCVPILPYHGGVALSFGLIILLFAAGIKTAREMLAIEQEKQIAIASGQAKTKFLANMSHEIRTPINTIIGMNEMILRENQNEDIERYAKNVQNASELLLGLISDILDFSKIEAGKVNILETEYHLSTLLTDVLKGIQIKADSKKLDVCVHVEETLPSVLEGDEIRIRQILNNLLSNAVKYTHEGRVTLTVKGLREKEKFTLCMEVEDTGIGIKPEDTEKLFESFHRLEENKNRYIEGTGLGLNICRQLVELMGGNIEVRSEYGKGSCFIVKIPQKIKDETMIGKLEEAYQRDISAKEESKQRLYAPTAEILVVDDNEMNLAVVKELLRRTAVKLTLVQSGAECLEICRKNKFDLILMDHMMPEPDGIETLHMLREDAANLNRDTHVIVLTANAIAGMAEMYLEEGFSDYLSKPVNPDILENVIRRHLPEQKLEEVPEVKKETKALSVPEESPQKENAGILCIDKTLGLEYCRNNEEMYREMVKMYCMQGEKHHQSLSDYYAAKDWKNYKITVHAVKSTSLMIGAKAFSEKAGWLEAAASEADEEILLKETELFLTEYREMLEILGR